MTRIALDTSAYSAFKRGHPEVTAAIRSANELLVCTVVLGELLGGFQHGSRNEVNRHELAQFLRSRRVRVVPVLQATSERYAVIYARLRGKGRPIPTNDIWIAASAMEHGSALVTLDSDYLRISQILVSCFEP